jgi:hypothetical protein
MVDSNRLMAFNTLFGRIDATTAATRSWQTHRPRSTASAVVVFFAW